MIPQLQRHSAASVALSKLTLAIAQLQSARELISDSAGEHRPSVDCIDEALLYSKRAYIDVEAVIARLSKAGAR
jgi:hypothetical protein